MLFELNSAMKTKRNRNRFKNEIADLIRKSNVTQIKQEIGHYKEQKIINPLFSFLYSTDELLKWRSVSAFGIVTDNLYKKNRESARIIMRRLIWNLNDESGGIGWGSPEAMGEIFTLNRNLAQEYGRILTSYIKPDCNYLEHEILQRGVLWGIAQFMAYNPDLTQDIEPYLKPYLKSHDKHLSTLALLCLPVGMRQAARGSLDLDTDTDRECIIYKNWQFEVTDISSITGGSFTLT